MAGYRKPRIVRPKEKDVPKGYDSKWEHKLHTTILKDWQHHSDKVSYIVEHEYEPDFVKTIGDKEYLLVLFREKAGGVAAGGTIEVFAQSSKSRFHLSIHLHASPIRYESESSSMNKSLYLK